jgi:hypothetical protein
MSGVRHKLEMKKRWRFKYNYRRVIDYTLLPFTIYRPLQDIDYSPLYIYSWDKQKSYSVCPKKPQKGTFKILAFSEFFLNC